MGHEEVCLIERKELFPRVDPQEDVALMERKNLPPRFDPQEAVGLMERKEPLPSVDLQEAVGLMERNESLPSVNLMERKESLPTVDPQEEIGSMAREEPFPSVDPREEVCLMERKEPLLRFDPQEEVCLMERKELLPSVEPQEDVNMMERQNTLPSVDPMEKDVISDLFLPISEVSIEISPKEKFLADISKRLKVKENRIQKEVDQMEEKMPAYYHLIKQKAKIDFEKKEKARKAREALFGPKKLPEKKEKLFYGRNFFDIFPPEEREAAIAAAKSFDLMREDA